MSEHYLQYKKGLLVSHDAVSLERFATKSNRGETRKELGFSDNQKICVYSGTISRLKGIEYVIEAAHLLPEVYFVLVGIVSSDYSKAVFPPNIKLLGKLDQIKLPNILQAADVLLLPHPKGEYSQSPMKLFEYMASGVPIVASRLPSISEILNDKNSILVEPDSGKAIAEGIKKSINNSVLAKNIAENALKDVQNFTWDKRGLDISEFIGATLKNSSKITHEN